MKRFFVVCALVAVVCAQSYAQQRQLSALPVCPEITTGEFSNGIRYYFVNNPLDKGLADFAVVQLCASGKEGEARAMLSSLENTCPVRFLHDHGAAYGPEGFVKYTSDSSRLFQFRNVRVDKPSVLDSALLVMRDIMAECRYPQGVIISGDINSATVRDRLALLCLTIAPASRSAGFPKIKDQVPLVSDSLEVSFALSKPERIYRNTAFPYIGNYMSQQVEYLFLCRLDKVLRNQGIPYSYTVESDVVSISTADEYRSEACECVEQVKRSICTYGFSMEEMALAQKLAIPYTADRAMGTALHNAQYVSKCTSAFLYNTDLAAVSTVVSALDKPRIQPQKDLERLNLFASGMLGACTDSSAEMQAVEFLELEDLLSMEFPKKKVKLMNTATDAVTGGKLYTFSNGMKVVFKRTSAQNGMFNYCLAMRGGYNLIEGLQAGEQPYIADVFATSRIAGVSACDFYNALGAHNIEMVATADWSNFSIEGEAPSGELSNVLAALVKVAYEREVDQEAFLYELQCETSGGEMPEISSGFPGAVSSYLDSRFLNLNDGVLMIIGNLDEEKLKSALGNYLTLARTGKKYSRKQVQTLGLNSGRTSSTLEGSGDQMRISMSCEHNITSETYLSFRTACAVMEKTLGNALYDEGMYVKVSGAVTVNPVESYTMNILCHPCKASGLPEGVTPAHSADLSMQIREIVYNMSTSGLGDAEFEACKAEAVSGLERLLANPKVLIRFAKYRYCDSRDICSDYAKQIKSVSRAKVDSVLSALNAGEIQELIVQ